jgi:hypothetical protein
MVVKMAQVYQKTQCFQYWFQVDNNTNVIISFYDVLFTPNLNILITEGTVFNTASLTFQEYGSTDSSGTKIFNTHQSFTKSPYFQFSSTNGVNQIIGLDTGNVVVYYTAGSIYDGSSNLIYSNGISIQLYTNAATDNVPPALVTNQKLPYIPKGQKVEVKILKNKCCIIPWNQMSDQAQPHVQKTSTSGTCSTKGTITRCRPNACCPGGIGVDVKHGSYDRYLRKLKYNKIKI